MNKAYLKGVSNKSLSDYWFINTDDVAISWSSKLSDKLILDQSSFIRTNTTISPFLAVSCASKLTRSLYPNKKFRKAKRKRYTYEQYVVHPYINS